MRLRFLHVAHTFTIYLIWILPVGSFCWLHVLRLLYARYVHPRLHTVYCLRAVLWLRTRFHFTRVYYGLRLVGCVRFTRFVRLRTVVTARVTVYVYRCGSRHCGYRLRFTHWFPARYTRSTIAVTLRFAVVPLHAVYVAVGSRSVVVVRLYGYYSRAVTTSLHTFPAHLRHAPLPRLPHLRSAVTVTDCWLLPHTHRGSPVATLRTAVCGLRTRLHIPRFCARLPPRLDTRRRPRFTRLRTVRGYLLVSSTTVTFNITYTAYRSHLPLPRWLPFACVRYARRTTVTTVLHTTYSSHLHTSHLWFTHTFVYVLPLDYLVAIRAYRAAAVYTAFTVRVLPDLVRFTVRVVTVAAAFTVLCGWVTCLCRFATVPAARLPLPLHLPRLPTHVLLPTPPVLPHRVTPFCGLHACYGLRFQLPYGSWFPVTYVTLDYGSVHCCAFAGLRWFTATRFVPSRFACVRLPALHWFTHTVPVLHFLRYTLAFAHAARIHVACLYALLRTRSRYHPALLIYLLPVTLRGLRLRRTRLRLTLPRTVGYAIYRFAYRAAVAVTGLRLRCTAYAVTYTHIVPRLRGYYTTLHTCPRLHGLTLPFVGCYAHWVTTYVLTTPPPVLGCYTRTHRIATALPHTTLYALHIRVPAHTRFATPHHYHMPTSSTVPGYSSRLVIYRFLRACLRYPATHYWFTHLFTVLVHLVTVLRFRVLRTAYRLRHRIACRFRTALRYCIRTILRLPITATFCSFTVYRSYHPVTFAHTHRLPFVGLLPACGWFWLRLLLHYLRCWFCAVYWLHLYGCCGFPICRTLVLPRLYTVTLPHAVTFTLRYVTRLPVLPVHLHTALPRVHTHLRTHTTHTCGSHARLPRSLLRCLPRLRITHVALPHALYAVYAHARAALLRARLPHCRFFTWFARSTAADYAAGSVWFWFCLPLPLRSAPAPPHVHHLRTIPLPVRFTFTYTTYAFTVHAVLPCGLRSGLVTRTHIAAVTRFTTFYTFITHTLRFTALLHCLLPLVTARFTTCCLRFVGYTPARLHRLPLRLPFADYVLRFTISCWITPFTVTPVAGSAGWFTRTRLPHRGLPGLLPVAVVTALPPLRTRLLYTCCVYVTWFCCVHAVGYVYGSRTTVHTTPHCRVAGSFPCISATRTRSALRVLRLLPAHGSVLRTPTFTVRSGCCCYIAFIWLGYVCRSFLPLLRLRGCCPFVICGSALPFTFWLGSTALRLPPTWFAVTFLYSCVLTFTFPTFAGYLWITVCYHTFVLPAVVAIPVALYRLPLPFTLHTRTYSPRLPPPRYGLLPGCLRCAYSSRLVLPRLPHYVPGSWFVCRHYRITLFYLPRFCCAVDSLPLRGYAHATGCYALPQFYTVLPTALHTGSRLRFTSFGYLPFGFLRLVLVTVTVLRYVLVTHVAVAQFTARTLPRSAHHCRCLPTVTLLPPY